MSDDVTTAPQSFDSPSPTAAPELAFMIAWSKSSPERVGELAFFPPKAAVAVVGRGGARDDDPGPRLAFSPARNALSEPATLTGRALSRVAVRIHARGRHLAIEGAKDKRCHVNGRALRKARLEVGDRIGLGDELLLMLVRRVRESAASPAGYPDFAFGKPDAFGIVGESDVAHRLRRDLVAFANRDEHVLIVGGPGSGKSAAAEALHGLSRSGRPYVARASASFVGEHTADELFGRAPGFPEHGAPERRGILEAADGGTLVFDDIDDAPTELHQKLLGFLDRGTYHRLGDPAVRRTNVRVIGITRDAERLGADLRERFLLDLRVPDFAEMREDLPLIIRQLLRDQGAQDSSVARHYYPDGEPRVDIDVIDRLLGHAFTSGGRELSRLLLLAAVTSDGDALSITNNVEARLRSPTTELPGRDEVEDALERNDGNISRAWKDLGLTSRHVLNRLVRRYGLKPRRKSDTG